MDLAEQFRGCFRVENEFSGRPGRVEALRPFPGLPDAWILHAIAVRHPFPNGNKCTAFAVADAILREEWGFPIGASQKEREVRGVKVIPSKLYLSRYRHHLHADGDDNRAEEGDPEDPA